MYTVLKIWGMIKREVRLPCSRAKKNAAKEKDTFFSGFNDSCMCDAIGLVNLKAVNIYDEGLQGRS